MLVELDSVLVQDYPKQAQRFMKYLDSENIPWIVIEFDNLFGIARKLVRSRLLPRLREAWCHIGPTSCLLNSLSTYFPVCSGVPKYLKPIGTNMKNERGVRPLDLVISCHFWLRAL